jgi:hypothetical protein
VLTLDRGPDASLGATVAVLPGDDAPIDLIVRQRPTASFGYSGYHLTVTRSGSDYTWELQRRDPQQFPVTLISEVGPDLEVGCWLGLQAAGDEITAWFVPAVDVVTDGETASFDEANATQVLIASDATYPDAGTYVVRLSDTTCRLDTLTGSGPVIYPDPPENTDLPRIIGTSHTGETLTCNPGSWLSSPDSFAYEWRRNGSPISGATSSAFTLTEDEEGRSLTCVVTATNAGGDGTAETAAVVPSRSTFGQPWAHDGTTWRALHARVV